MAKPRRPRPPAGGSMEKRYPRVSQRSDITRRSFAGASALGGITFLAQPQRVFGANDRVRVAICGVHGRGMDHVKSYSKLSNVEIAAVCDIDENLASQR